MKFQFLGTAAATSIPLVFCNCKLCRQARRNKGKDYRKRSSAIINDELLIDLGPDLCSQAQQYDIDLGKIKYLVQTHSHSDHFDGGHFITRWSDYATKDLTHLDIVCSEGTCKDMNHWVKENEPTFDITDELWKKDMNYDLHLLKSGEHFMLGEYEIVAIDSGHDPRVEAFVYVIGYHGTYVFYGTDLLQLSNDAFRVMQSYRFDCVILDQTYGTGFNQGGHLDRSQVLEIIKQMRNQQMINDATLIYATHISHEGNGTFDEMEAQAIQDGYHIAYDGLAIQL